MIAMKLLVCGSIAFYLVWRWVVARKRNRASWEQIVSRLREYGDARRCCAPERSGVALRVGLLARGQQTLGTRGLWAMYANAGVLVELADYAARNGAPEDQAAVDVLRTEAMLIRLNVLACVSSFALRAAEDRVEHFLLRAEQAYAELEVYLSDLLEQQAPELLPAFVAAS